MRRLVCSVVVGALAGCPFTPGQFGAAPDDATDAPTDDAPPDATPDAPVARVCDPDPSLLLCLSFDAETFGATMQNEGTANVAAQLTEVGRSDHDGGGAIEVTPASTIYIPPDPSLTGAATIEAWVRIDVPPASAGARVGILDADPTASAMSLFYYRQAGGYQVRFEISQVRYVDHEVPAGTWVYLAETCDNDTLTSYIDGELVDTATGCIPGVAATYGLILGANNLQNGNRDNQLTGAIDAVRVWTTPRTATQICQAAKRPVCP